MLIFSNIKKLILAIKNGKKTLRGKLILYFVLVILSLFSVFMLLLLLTDNVMNPRKQIESVLSYQLQNTYDEISIDMDAFTGYGMQLSKDLGREIEQFLQEEKLELEDLNNNPEKLMEVQKIMYSGLNTQYDWGVVAECLPLLMQLLIRTSRRLILREAVFIFVLKMFIIV